MAPVPHQYDQKERTVSIVHKRNVKGDQWRASYPSEQVRNGKRS